MKKAILFFLIGLAPSPLFLRGGEAVVLQSSWGAQVDVEAASFTPGDIMIARLLRSSKVKKVTVRFSQTAYELGSKEEGLEPLVLIGLDVALPPGKAILEALFLGRDGQIETVSQEFFIQPREFPVKKLRVEERFVTPPPELQERIAWEAELLQTLYRILTPRWLAEGRFILPHAGKMAPNFGERRLYNNVPRPPHSGVDISAPAGDPVRASNTGRVILARDLYFSGQTVILDHGLGLFTSYCHFSQIKVRRGELVRKGEVIGLIGSTGRSTGPHLHWGVRILDSRVDPVALINLPLEE